MRAMAPCFAGFAILFGMTAAALGEPLDERELATAFQLSTKCESECRNESVNMVRLALPRGKIGFLITTNDLGFCGSGGCASVVVVVSGDRFAKIKEGLGITKTQAVTLASGEASPPLATSSASPNKIIFPMAVSAAYSNEPEDRARLLTCRDQYNANKGLNANGGLEWTGQGGGGYYATCNQRLASTRPASPSSGTNSPPGAAGQPVTTQECARKYQAAKAAGTLGGRLWNDFRRTECGSGATTSASGPNGR